MFFIKVLNGKLIIWKATKANEYFISASKFDLIIGGPKPAIYLNARLGSILSEPCETFNSPILIMNKDGDLILDLEVYQLI